MHAFERYDPRNLSLVFMVSLTVGNFELTDAYPRNVALAFRGFHFPINF